MERTRIKECATVVTFSIEVQRAGELRACSSYHWNGGQRHRRGWYRQER